MNINNYEHFVEEFLTENNDLFVECFFQQFLTFSEFMNDSHGRIPDFKYAEFLLWLLHERLKDEFPPERL